MGTIWKYSKPVHELTDWISFQIPAKAKVLSVGNQNETLCIWVEVERPTPVCKWFFRIAGTGHPLVPDDQTVLPVLGRFIGTVLFAQGSLVFHVYQESE